MLTGRRFADFVFIPKPEYVEEYPSAFEQYTGNILLVGISYDKKNKEHQCVIEELVK